MLRSYNNNITIYFSLMCFCDVIIHLFTPVAIERYIRLWWATVVGMCRFYLWFTVGELRLPGRRVTP